MNKRAVCLLLSALLLSAASCAKTPVRAVDDFYYGRMLSDEVPGSFPLHEAPSGLSKDVCIPERADSSDPESVNAGFAGLFSESDLKTVFQKNVTERMYPASMTKLMTALLVAESGLPLSELVTVTEEAFSGLPEDASIAYLVRGAQYSVEDLLYGLLLPSGNDAANALAIAVSGSVPAFVEKMNQKAQALGMLNTHFANPSGLHDKAHYTTVYDLYLLANALKKYPEIAGISTSNQHDAACRKPDGSVLMQNYVATNSYVRKFVNLPDGLVLNLGKTGNTAEAGRCLILEVTSEKGNSYIAVVGKVNGYDALYTEMNHLLEKISQYENEN